MRRQGALQDALDTYLIGPIINICWTYAVQLGKNHLAFQIVFANFLLLVYRLEKSWNFRKNCN